MKQRCTCISTTLSLIFPKLAIDKEATELKRQENLAQEEEGRMKEM